MLNYETILSSYDDKLTLMQWLKKVEAAFENASATAFHVNKRGDATLTFSIDFEDGTSIESEPIVLQQGESVASARISNGQLILTLTNGDELNAGNILNGNLNLNGNLVVSNNIETEFLNVRDTATLESAEITGSASVGGGLDVEGDITGGSIIENMSGYTFAKNSDGANYQNNITYASVCKNGNKLTFVVSGNIVVSAQIAVNTLLNIGVFNNVPSPVGSKIVPFGGGLGTQVAYQRILMVQSRTIKVNNDMILTKNSNTSFAFQLNASEALAVGTHYYRSEFTFILSDSLA